MVNLKVFKPIIWLAVFILAVGLACGGSSTPEEPETPTVQPEQPVEQPAEPPEQP